MCLGECSIYLGDAVDLALALLGLGIWLLLLFSLCPSNWGRQADSLGAHALKNGLFRVVKREEQGRRTIEKRIRDLWWAKIIFRVEEQTEAEITRGNLASN